MGLSILYQFYGHDRLQDSEVRDRVRQTARLARKIGCAHVGKVLHSDEQDPDAPEFFDSRSGNERRMFGGPRTRGWLVEIWPGKGCAPCVLGLCRSFRLARRPKNRRESWLPHYEPYGWRLDAHCKTYYAAEHGLDHFVHCHEQVVRLLDFWRGRGVRACVLDNGGFWKTRSREQLAAQIGDHDLFLKVARSRIWG